MGDLLGTDHREEWCPPAPRSVRRRSHQEQDDHAERVGGEAASLSVPDQQPPGREEDEGQRDHVDHRAVAKPWKPRQVAGIREVVGGALPTTKSRKLSDRGGLQLVAEDHQEEPPGGAEQAPPRAGRSRSAAPVAVVARARQGTVDPWRSPSAWRRRTRRRPGAGRRAHWNGPMRARRPSPPTTRSPVRSRPRCERRTGFMVRTSSSPARPDEDEPHRIASGNRPTSSAGTQIC